MKSGQTLFRFASDLHLEFGPFSLPPLDSDKESTLILAGDICTVRNLTDFNYFFSDVSKRFRKVIVIMGNHEHYGLYFSDADYVYRDYLKNYSNITLLNNESITIDDTVITGSTLWTDFDNANITYLYGLYRLMNDYTKIGHLTPELVFKQHKTSLVTLCDHILQAREEGKKCIVVSHHAPSEKSIHEHYKHSELNPMYFSHLDSMIEADGPDVWIHGHVHNSFDYNIGKTRVLCNPMGHKGENMSFNGTKTFSL